MKEISANIWDVFKDYDAIVCPTNGVVKTNGELVMGGGLAKQFKEKFPYIPYIWGSHVKRYGNHLGKHSHDGNPELPALVSFPSKHHWKDVSDIDLIRRSTQELVECADYQDYKKVLLPKVGCGLGGLTWKEVKPVLEKYLDKRFTIISFAEHKHHEYG
jgi:O-acetyl-ADP-ribose deacetylase (regulator of RNase III)